MLRYYRYAVIGSNQFGLDVSGEYVYTPQYAATLRKAGYTVIRISVKPVANPNL